MEALLLLAMFLVLAVHANNLSLGQPTVEAAVEAPVGTFTRMFLQQACIVCVDVFVLISGGSSRVE